MTFTCKIEPSDYSRATWVHIKPRPAFATIGAFLLGLALLVFGTALYRFVSTGIGLIYVLVLGFLLTYLVTYFVLWLPRQVNRLYAQQKLLHVEFEVEISDDHLITRSTHGTSKLPWSTFHKWKSGGDIVLLYQSDAMFHLFPKRFFPSAEDFKSFQEILKKHLGPPKT